MKHPRGALLPEDMAWQEGKTAGSIRFVATAEKMIDRLHEKIAQVKNGDEVIVKFLDMGSIIKMIDPIMDEIG